MGFLIQELRHYDRPRVVLYMGYKDFLPENRCSGVVSVCSPPIISICG